MDPFLFESNSLLAKRRKSNPSVPLVMYASWGYKHCLYIKNALTVGEGAKHLRYYVFSTEIFTVSRLIQIYGGVDAFINILSGC